MANRTRQSGAVAIFSVIFATLLLSVLVTGFVRLMVRDQQQALNNDLSQSAYDAALAGVEDAKRVVRVAESGGSGAVLARKALSDGKCTTIQYSGVISAPSTQEVMVKSDTAGERFDQAYTCVKVAMDTPDYLYEAFEGQTWLVPLRASNAFDTISIQWYTEEDAGMSTIGSPAPAPQLPKYGEWKSASPVPGMPTAPVPPLLRAQVISPGVEIDLDTLNQTGRTVFLRPRHVVSPPSTPSELDLVVVPRATGVTGVNNEQQTVSCASFASPSREYACEVTLKTAEVSKDASANAFLRLTPIYAHAHVRIVLKKGSDIVSFNGVQPAVDSTGRANNLFRRVEARLQLGDKFAYPEGVVDIAGNICKDFSVTDTGITAGMECDPATTP